IVVAVKVVVPPSPATSVGPSADGAPRIPRKGIVTVYGWPVSGLEVIGPSKGGYPAALLIMATAAAPACWPKIARATRAQVPRFVTASFPETLAATYSAGLQPRLTLPSVFLSTTTGIAPDGRVVTPFALIATTDFPEGLRSSLTAGKVAFES